MSEDSGSVEKSDNKDKPASGTPIAAAGEKPAVAKANAVPKKPPAKPKDPLVDNDDGTITDPNTGFMWKKSDAWVDMKRFYTWFNHREYVDQVNGEKFAGYENWRVPSKAEAVSLHNKEKECLDKNGSVFFVDPIFESGGVGNTWISESSDEKIIRYDWKTGVDTTYPSPDIWGSIRLIRKEGEEPPTPIGGTPEDPTEPDLSATTTTETVDAPAKPNAKQATAPPAGGGKKGPTPRRDFSDSEKAEMLKRAKAHAAEIKKRKGL